MAARIQPWIIICVLLLLVGFFILYIQQYLNVTQSTLFSSSEPVREVSEMTIPQKEVDSAIEQRNKLSAMMNSFKQEFGIMSCEMIELKKKLNISVSTVSASGGWCKQSSANNSGVHMFDKGLAKELSSFFKSKRVASFGDGPGDYKRYLDSTKNLVVYDAYDGAPYGPETSGGVVKFLDLTAPQYGLPVYDWVISLEVAEHIPAQYEAIYVDNIVRHAETGIVLSWAVPGQGGLSHVNNKPISYVKDLMSKKGFEINMEKSTVLQKAALYSWLKKNIYVYYRRKDSSAPPSQA